MTARWWSGKRVFITGHTGFKGGWCSLWLCRLGADVTGYALAPDSQPNLFEHARVADGMTSIFGDVLDVERMTSSVAKSKPEIVLHLAAQPLVRVGYEQPVATYATNVLGTANIIDAARRTSGVRAVVVVTSDKCYRLDDLNARHAESDPLGGRDPYSASKAAAEFVTAGLRTAFFDRARPPIGLASVRAGNVIGGGDWAGDRLLPDLLEAFESGAPAAVRNPDAIRPWQHVLDPLAGYLALGQRLCDDASFARAWNLGPPVSHEQTVGWVADTVAARWGAGATWATVKDGVKFAEAPALRLDSSLAQQRLGWKAKLELPAALEWTVQWRKDLRAGKPARDLTLAQIERYEALAA
jgi:CDP-glucose 4,6-dehydratase